MQIVVNIPERTMKHILDAEETLSEVNDLIRRVARGIPLPKGHGDLKDTDKIISKICGSSCGCYLEECGRDKPCDSVAMIDSASTIIEADKEK